MNRFIGSNEKFLIYRFLAMTMHEWSNGFVVFIPIDKKCLLRQTEAEQYSRMSSKLLFISIFINKIDTLINKIEKSPNKIECIFIIHHISPQW